MKVKEMREKIENLKKDGKVENQNVEFVLNSKKYFPSEIKAGTNTMAVVITRDNFHPLTIDQLEENLKLAGSDLPIKVMEGKNEKTISESYLTDMAFELVVE